MPRWRQAIAALVLAANAPAIAVELLPSQPRAGQDFVLHFTAYIGCGVATTPTLSVSDSTIAISYREADACYLLPPGFYMNLLANVPQPGTYRVIQKSLNTSSTRDEGLITVLPSNPAATRTSTSLAGLWYVPSQPGWGLNVAEGQSGQLFLTWFTYGYTGGTGNYNYSSPYWFFTSGGRWTSPTEFTGILAQGQGTDFSRPFDPNYFMTRPAGTATLTVTGPDTLTFTPTYAFAEGVKTQSFNLTRYKF